MLNRIRTALVLLPVTLLLIWVPQLRLGFTFFIVGLVLVGLGEYFVLVRRRGIEPEVVGAGLVIVALLFTAHWGSLRHMNLALTIGFLLVTVCHLFFRWHTIAGMTAALFGVMYVGWLPAHFVLLRGIDPTGPGLLTLLLGAVALSDSAAMYIGARYGRHKLAPQTSPNKSWEGAVAGLAGGALAALICYG
ncbi:MAG TPA: phosphatidate cytidylyltransferase, partial [Candidatus Hydrogenedentes bacterium]|nr:phosphatidate cytidylyltransferase [Candidatus Hydrogenedentota bacterium]